MSVIGDEKHFLVECTNPSLVNNRTVMFDKIHRICQQFSNLDPISKFNYMFSGKDITILPNVCSFIT